MRLRAWPRRLKTQINQIGDFQRMDQDNKLHRRHPRLLAVKLTTISISGLFFLAGCSFSLAEDITPPPGAEVPQEMPTQPPLSGPLYPLVPPDPSAGGQIYAEKCAPCHGSSGLGDGSMAGQLPVPAPALGTEEVARVSSPAEWYTIITQGNLENRMPPFSSLTDRQRWDVVAYLYWLSSTTERIEQGQELYEEQCAACHGEKGGGDGAETASLSVKPTKFTDQQLMADISDEQLFEAISGGKAPDMPAYEDKLSPEERWAIAAYLRSLTFAPHVKVSDIPETPGPTAVTTSVPQETESVAGFGQVEGQVINTAGGEIPSDLTVTLYGFDQMQQTFSAQAQVEADGKFAFDEVAMPAGRAFLASIEYDGVPYSSDVAVVDPDLTSLVLDIPYYETTTDTSLLSVDRLHVLFEYIEPETLRVVEMYVISNPGDRTVTAAEDGQPVISYALPDGATNLQFQDGVVGERYVELPNGFGDLAVVRPGAGQHQVIYSYDLPYQNKLDFDHPIDLPVNAVVVMLPEDGIKIKSEQLSDMGTRDVQGLSYRLYSSDLLRAGSNLDFYISGRPRTGGAHFSLGSSTNLVIGLVAFGFTLILAGGWLYMRTRNGIPEQDLEETDGYPAAAEYEQDVDMLLDAILALDDQYRAGELPEEAYTKRRAELKARIRELMASKGAGE
jgi:mono/diheme cytochrome c family protein